MKKLLIIISFFFLCLALTSCNYDMMDMHYQFYKVHTTFDGEHYQCYEIISWTDYEGEQIQVNIKDYGIVVVSSYNAILVADKCPYCDKGE